MLACISLQTDTHMLTTIRHSYEQLNDVNVIDDANS